MTPQEVFEYVIKMLNTLNNEDTLFSYDAKLSNYASIKEARIIIDLNLKEEK